MLYFIISLFLSSISLHQEQPKNQTITFKILDEESRNPLIGATAFIKEVSIGKSSNDQGIVTFDNLQSGKFTFQFRYIGYESKTVEFELPITQAQPITIDLEHEHEGLEEITVSTTRTTRTIEDSPTRVEAITIEEIGEKGNMRPGDIRMLLAESTGIQVQQTSAISGSSNFRIQGLDGRYTQLLKDGFPLYGGFSGGLSIMQIPPLDLYQVEIIKGSNSTLYGGGAIAGLVNLISKSPTENREISFLANKSSAKNLDFSGFYSEKHGLTGVTLFSAYNQNSGYNPSGEGFSAIPKFERFTLNPKLTWTNEKNIEVMVGAQITLEDRLGGDMLYLNNQNLNDRFFERNESNRISSQFSLNYNLNDRNSISFKNSISLLDRSIEVPDYIFAGNQVASFSELSFTTESSFGTISSGLNYWTDKFDENEGNSLVSQDTKSEIVGAFIQSTSSINEFLSLEVGLRTDIVRPKPNHNLDGVYILPRFSVLYRFNSSWSMRLGGGAGYKNPQMFIDEAENLAFRNVAPPDLSTTKAEQSFGFNYDVNYRSIIADKIVFRVNQLFFATHLDNPLILENDFNNLISIVNLDGSILSRGSETNLAIIIDHIKMFLGYTFIDAQQEEEGELKKQVPFNSPHQINAILMLEEHGSYRLGFEAYYYSPQKLSDNSTSEGYTIFGIMGEKTWGKISLFANFENIFDTRQTKFGPIYTGSRQDPDFVDIFAPVEGSYINVGIKLKL